MRFLLGEMQANLNRAGLRVLLDIGEPLLSYAVECHERIVGESFLAAVHFKINGQAMLAQLFYEKRYPPRTSKRFSFCAQYADRTAYILQGIFRYLLRIADRLQRYPGLFLLVDERFLQLEGDGDERMTKSVMNLARNPVTLFRGRKFGNSFGIGLELPVRAFHFRQQFLRPDATGLLSDASRLFQADDSCHQYNKDDTKGIDDG